jgi:lipoprotein-releasing system permease protein
MAAGSRWPSRRPAKPQVLAAAPFVQAQGMLSFDQTVRGALVRGMLPAAEDRVADFART